MAAFPTPEGRGIGSLPMSSALPMTCSRSTGMFCRTKRPKPSRKAVCRCSGLNFLTEIMGRVQPDRPAREISMSVRVDPCASPPSGTLSCYVTTVTAVAAAITFSATGAAPTPLYYEYQQHFGLTPFMITMIFAAYVLCLLLALLTVGSLSDYIGRRPTILAALALNVLAMILFMTAGSAAALNVARAMQGFATGMAITTLAAIILDTDKERAPLLNSFTAFAGLSAGTLGAGALVTFAPAPEQLVFVVLLILSVVEAAILWFMPETATAKPGALASLRPRVHVPRGDRHNASHRRRPRCGDSDLLGRCGRGGATQARSGEDVYFRHRHVGARRGDNAG